MSTDTAFFRRNAVISSVCPEKRASAGENSIAGETNLPTNIRSVQESALSSHKPSIETNKSVTENCFSATLSCFLCSVASLVAEPVEATCLYRLLLRKRTDVQTELVELGLVDLGRSVDHHVTALVVLREGDEVTDGLLAGE